MTAFNHLKTEFFLQAEGLAPNSYRATMQALGFIEKLPRFRKIADIGSGTGQQTVILYEATNAQIIAVDFNDQFVKYLEAELEIQKLNNRISPVLSQPDNLPFFAEELDMIWAESIVNVVNLKFALNAWGKYLKKGGYVGLCSYCWLQENSPQIVSEYWNNSEKEIDTISSRIRQFEESGFITIAHFVMPDECWWNYFCPLEKNFGKFLQKYPDSPEAGRLVKEIDMEIDFFEKYGEHYGYVFFVGRKI